MSLVSSRKLGAVAIVCGIMVSTSNAFSEPLELITDRHFKAAMSVLDPPQGALVIVDVLRMPGVTGDPVWEIAQWDSLYSLEGATPESLPSGATQFSDTSKKVIVSATDTADSDLTLALNSTIEYGADARGAGEPWPHLLIEQRLSPPNTPGPGCPAVTEMSALMFRVDALLQYDVRFKPPGYTTNLHAAQFLIYFTLQNLNVNSPGYGDFLWIGLSLYDDRYYTSGLSVIEGDVALSKLIYLMPQSAFTGDSLHDGEWVHFETDIHPYLVDALNEAWTRGFLPGSQDPSDYRLGGILPGWELPGSHNTAVQMRDLSLRAVFPGEDSDGDGLTDTQELIDLDSETSGLQNPFDPTNPDTDDDGFFDGLEFDDGTDPSNPSSNSPLAEVSVEIGRSSVLKGTLAEPLATLSQAVRVAAASGVVKFANSGSTSDVLTITTPMTIQATAGVVRIGE